jgi:hypothetical protein
VFEFICLNSFGICKAFPFPPLVFLAFSPANPSPVAQLVFPSRGPALLLSRAPTLRPKTAQYHFSRAARVLLRPEPPTCGAASSSSTSDRARADPIAPAAPCPRAGRAPARSLPWDRASGPPCPFIARRRTEAPNPSYTAPLPPHNPRPPPPLSIPLGRCHSFIVEQIRRFVRR